MSTDETNVHFEEKTQSVRLNPNDNAALQRVIEANDEFGNASDAIRQLIRRADDRADPEGGPALRTGREEPDDDELATAWDVLKRLTNGGGGWLRTEQAKVMLAQKCGVSKNLVYGTLLRPLSKRGYIKMQTDATGRQSGVFVRR